MTMSSKAAKRKNGVVIDSSSDDSNDSQSDLDEVRLTFLEFERFVKLDKAYRCGYSENTIFSLFVVLGCLFPYDVM